MKLVVVDLVFRSSLRNKTHFTQGSFASQKERESLFNTQKNCSNRYNFRNRLFVVYLTLSNESCRICIEAVMFRRIYWMFVVIELEGVYDVNRRHLLYYFRLRVSSSRAYCFALENQSFSCLLTNSLLLSSNSIAFALQSHCFYTSKAMLLFI